MIKTAIQLKTIGSILEDRRKDRGLTLKEVAEITKIKTEYLHALEKGDYSLFASEVYLKGFLRNYAKFLGVGTERALALYRRERSDFEKLKPIGITSKIRETTLNLAITPGRIIAIIVLGLILGTLYYVGTYVGAIFAAPQLSLETPLALEAGATEVYNTESTTIKIEGQAEIGAKLTINGEKYQTNNFQDFFAEFELEEGTNEFIINAESQFGKVSTIELKVVRTSIELEPSPTPAALAQMQISIEIINRDAYVEVEIDGTQVIGRTLQLGSTTELTAQQLLTISSPRPDAVKLLINGQEYVVKTTDTNFRLENGEIIQE